MLKTLFHLHEWILYLIMLTTLICIYVLSQNKCSQLYNITSLGKWWSYSFFSYLIVVSNSAVDHLVNTVSLGHTFNFEEVTDTSVFHQLLVRIWNCMHRTPKSLFKSLVRIALTLWSISPAMKYCEFVIPLFSGYKFLGKCLSDICCSSLPTSNPWKNHC